MVRRGDLTYYSQHEHGRFESPEAVDSNRTTTSRMLQCGSRGIVAARVRSQARPTASAPDPIAFRVADAFPERE